MRSRHSTLVRAAAILVGLPLALAVAAGGYFTVTALGRERPQVVSGTEHPEWSRADCIECHEPIAAEWRQSFHFRSATGPFWTRLRSKGYAGMNSLIVDLKVRDAAGAVVEQTERVFGTRELLPGYLDFWPFMVVGKIPAGESRELAISLPEGAGTVEAEIRYRDWFAIDDQDLTIATLSESY